jgi:exonuclease SbcC
VRLHRLRVQAFGPFAGVEEVDVDEVASAGLFLLTGPTGAGKTSVLDAVCFALYGQVPGARAEGAARGLRSDHAPPGLAPEVVCELTVAGRRFEVTRSPAWERPKKRGDGHTAEPARTLLRERVGGVWVPRSSRNDEASQLLTDALGMGLEQFTKVVLLPQGEFAAFLRAGAEQRRPLLQRLFGTDRFAAVEAWLSDERRRLARAVEDADAHVHRLLAQADQAVVGLPDPPTSDGPSSDGPDPVRRVQALHTAVSEYLDRCRAEHADAVAAREVLVRRHDVQRQRAERAARLSAAVAQTAELEAAAPAREASAAELREARRAAQVAGHLEALRDACGRLADATQKRCACEQQAGAGVEDPADLGDEGAVRELAAALRRDLGRLGQLSAGEAEGCALRARAAVVAAELDAVARRLDDEDVAAAARRAERAELGERLAVVEVEVADLGAAAAAVPAAEAVFAAAEAAERLGGEAAAAADAVRGATDTAQRARDAWLDVRERRLAGMAAELAAGLRDGDPCPVCGAEQHPRPAAPAPRAVSAEREDAARLDCESAERARSLAERHHALLRERLAAEQAAAGGRTPRAGRAELDRARRRARRAEAAATEAAAARERLAVLDTQDDEARRRRADLAERAAVLRADDAACRSRAGELEETVARACGQDTDLAARTARLTSLASSLDVLLEARGTERHAVTAVERAREAAVAACRAAGLGDVASAEAASRPAGRVAELEAVVRDHDDRLAANRSRLADPDLVVAAADGSDPDELGRAVTALAARLRGADERLDSDARALALAERAATSLEDLLQHTDADVAAAAPVRRQHAVVDALARCAEGTGGDNSLRMRLSAFVLAARLEQVAEAATVRLATMSVGRYALVHSDAAERRGARSGLGLRVVDGWTGRERDTSTLSGGESFLASLALALGLADVVQAEAGGAAIETLFVDEGFGTLDEETLEEVMTTLDGLREGGRAVGLVSHVAELRQRVPARIEVVKTRSGSHLRSARRTGSGRRDAGGDVAPARRLRPDSPASNPHADAPRTPSGDEREGFAAECVR